jgi:hypothetical protein
MDCPHSARSGYFRGPMANSRGGMLRQRRRQVAAALGELGVLLGLAAALIPAR